MRRERDFVAQLFSTEVEFIQTFRIKDIRYLNSGSLIRDNKLQAKKNLSFLNFVIRLFKIVRNSKSIPSFDRKHLLDFVLNILSRNNEARN